MQIINDVSRNSYNNELAFGTTYTRSSIKLLKNFIPEILAEDGFVYAKNAVNNLAQAGKRKDNLILKIKDVDTLGMSSLKFYARYQSKKINGFREIGLPEIPAKLGKKDSQNFEALTSFINSDEFLQKTRTVLGTDDKLPLFQRIKFFMNEKKDDLIHKIENISEMISEEVFCVTETPEKTEWTVITDIKDFCKNLFSKEKNPYKYSDKQKEEANLLAKMLDDLPIEEKSLN